MNRIGGWIDGRRKFFLKMVGSQIGGRLAASMRIYTKGVICNGQKHMEVFRQSTVYVFECKSSKQITLLKEKPVWKPGRTTETAKARKNGQKKTKKVSRWKDVARVLYEAGLLIKERKASWQKSLKESQE